MINEREGRGRERERERKRKREREREEGEEREKRGGGGAGRQGGRERGRESGREGEGERETASKEKAHNLGFPEDGRLGDSLDEGREVLAVVGRARDCQRVQRRPLPRTGMYMSDLP